MASSSAAALQAAALSLNNGLRSQQRQRSAPPLSRSTCAATHLTARDRDPRQPRSSSGTPRSDSPAQHSRDRDPTPHNCSSPVPPTHTPSTLPKSPSFIAANMAWPSPKTPMRTADLHQDREEILPPRGSVKAAKSRLLQPEDSSAAGSDIMVPVKPAILQRHSAPNAADVAPIEDTSSLINMFGGRLREVGDIRSNDNSSSVSASSGSAIRKTTGSLLKKNSTGPVAPAAIASTLAPKPVLPGAAVNPSVTVARLASQRSSVGSGRSSSAQSDVCRGRTGGNEPEEGNRPHQMDTDGARTITLPVVHPVLRSKSSGISATSKRLSRQADSVTDERHFSPPQLQKRPSQPAPARKAPFIIKPMDGAEPGSDHGTHTDAPEQPIPRAAPAPPAPRRNRGPRRHAPTQTPKRPAPPSVPQPPVPRSGRDSLPIVAPRKTDALFSPVPPNTPPRQPTTRSTTSSVPLPVTVKPLSRNPTGASCTPPFPTTTNTSTLNHAILASSLASSRISPIPPAQPTLNLPSLQRRPKKKPVVPPPPPPLRRRRSEPSIGARIGAMGGGGGGIRTTMRAPAPPPKPKPPVTAPRILSTHKHKHKHSASLHPLHLSDTIISEKERKRYEGVWAANCGYLMETLAHLLSQPRPPPPPPQQQQRQQQQQQQYTRDVMLSEGIHPLVAKDIWARSRLPQDSLSGIWKLVDRGAKGWLCREEFVIGMWLIDRCLHGKKLPMGDFLADAVWASVRRLGV